MVHHKLSMVMRNRIWFLSGIAMCIDFCSCYSTYLQVQGIGSPNPFRLRSLLGARIPLNATYSPLITMYNPFSTSLQVSQTGNAYLIKFLTSSSYLCSQIILTLLGQLQELDLLWGHLIALCSCDVSIANSP